MRKRHSACFVTLGLEYLELRETPAAGLLDPTFGTGGLVMNAAGNDAAAVAVQSNGKILVGGDVLGPGGKGTPAVFRYNANGALNTAFGVNGVALSPFGSLDFSTQSFPVQALAVQPSGAIVVEAPTNTSGGSAIYRLTAAGQYDPTFGVGGTAPTQFGALTFQPVQIAVQTDGKVLALGFLNAPNNQTQQIALLRYGPNGKLDAAFGTSGGVLLPWSSLPSAQSVTPGSVAIQANGHIVVSGSVLTSANPAYPTGAVVVSRFNSNGQLDASFNGNGTNTIASPALFVNSGNPNQIAFQPNGRIVVTAESLPGVFAAIRLNPNGTLDPTYGLGGIALVRVSQGDPNSPLAAGGEAVSIAVQSDGSMLLAGDAETPGNRTIAEFAIVRLTHAGMPDPAFGANGVMVTAFPNANPSFAIGQAVAVQPNGDAVVVGGGGETPSSIQPYGAELLMAAYQTANVTSGNVVSTITLTAPATAAFDVPVQLTATVATPSRNKPPTGTVTFLDGPLVVGAAVLGMNSPAGTASISVPLVPGGNRITAVYSGDASDLPSTSAASFVTVTAGTATVALSASAPAVGLGQPVTFTATVTSANLPLGVGTVLFLDGKKVIGTLPVGNQLSIDPTSTVFGGTAVLTISNLMVGAHSITAQYTRDPFYTAAPSSAVTVTITNPQASTTALSASSLSPTFGQTVTLAATVTGTSVSSPAGSVTFLDGTTILGTVAAGTNGQAQFTSTTLAAGTHNFTASYSGNSSALSSASTVVPVVVAKAATQVTVSANPTAPVYGQSITLAALIGSAVQGAQFGAGSVTFTAGTTLLGTSPVTAGAGTLILTSASPGKQTITVSYTGDANHAPSSTTFTFTVSPAPTATTLTLPTTVKAGQSLTLSAAVAALNPLLNTPTGQVTFLDGTTVLGTATLTKGAATLTLTKGLTAGKHSITVQFGGSTLFAPSQVEQNVTAA